MYLFLLILITSVGVAKAANSKKLTLKKSSTPCTVYAKDADLSNQNDGILYTGSLKETRNDKQVEVKYGICCPKSYKQSQTTFRSSSSRAVCCQQGKGSICYSKDGYRACPGFVCLAYPTGKSTAAQVNIPFTCPDAVTLKPEGRIRQPDLIVYKDKVNCKDPSKKYQIVTIKRGQKSPPAYRWCCSEDITSNFTVKPSDVCCGLAASQPPNNNLMRMATNVDTPPCCRKLQNKNNCDPAPLDITTSNGNVYFTYRVCRSNSGGPQTPNLNENLPAFSVLHYFFMRSNSLSQVNVETKKIYACDQKGSELLYSVLDAIVSSINPGVCCPKNIFYSDASTMAKECCITFVSVSPSTTGNDYSCSATGKGFIRDGKIYYRSCEPKACKSSSKDSTIGRLSNQTIITPFNVSQDVAQPLYGVYDWYKNKYFV